jgi:glucose-6-phosphate 1-dehydrogenase
MLLDVLRGNSALFVRRDEIEASWKWIDGIVEGWRTKDYKSRPYSAGSWGPSAAIGLLERHGHSWRE